MALGTVRHTSHKDTAVNIHFHNQIVRLVKVTLRQANANRNVGIAADTRPLHPVPHRPIALLMKNMLAL